MLAQRLRRWANIKQTSNERLFLGARDIHSVIKTRLLLLLLPFPKEISIICFNQYAQTDI